MSPASASCSPFPLNEVWQDQALFSAAISRTLRVVSTLWLGEERHLVAKLYNRRERMATILRFKTVHTSVFIFLTELFVCPSV